MTVDVWFRNPHNYIRELAEVGDGRIAWDRGMLEKRRIDPIKHAQTYFKNMPWRVMLIGEQGSAEYTHESPTEPVGVYVTWDAATETMELLEELMQFPIGNDADACNDPSLPLDERPVAGQEHRIVIINIPEQNRGPGRAFIRKLLELQEEYPECKLHLHGLYSWRVCFGMGFVAADVDPRTNAGKGKVTLPSGKEMIAERTVQSPGWVNLLGMKPIDLTREPRNRCIFNIKSALWAAENFMENVAFATKRTQQVVAKQVDTTSATAKPIETVKKTPFTAPVIPQPTDKIACNTCTLANKCKFYREGSVCSVPGSEPASLASQFRTRDADVIIDGLTNLLSLQARRLERGIAEEDVFGELDPEVTKIANQLFTNGSKLAKLVDPTRFAGPKVQVNVETGGSASIGAATPNQVLGSIVRELESRGIPRDQITPEMVSGLLGEMGAGKPVAQLVEGTVISRDEP